MWVVLSLSLYVILLFWLVFLYCFFIIFVQHNGQRLILLCYMNKLTNWTEKVLSPCFEFVSFKNEIYEPTMLNILEQ